MERVKPPLQLHCTRIGSVSQELRASPERPPPLTLSAVLLHSPWRGFLPLVPSLVARRSNPLRFGEGQRPTVVRWGVGVRPFWLRFAATGLSTMMILNSPWRGFLLGSPSLVARQSDPLRFGEGQHPTVFKWGVGVRPVLAPFRNFHLSR